MARGLCAYTTLDGSAIPARSRRGFADMAVSRWAPFADPQALVEWAGDRAMVWAWSKAQVLALDPATGRAPPVPRRIVPETLLRGTAQADGEVLIAMDQGFEGRAWKDGFLVAACWWAEIPGVDEWNQFRRGVGQPPVREVPEAAQWTLADRPWTAQKMRGIGTTLGEQRRVLAAAGAGIAAAAIFSLLTASAALKISIWQVERDIAQREQGLVQIIAARDAALADAGEVQSLLDSRPAAGPTQLFVEVGKLMGSTWRLQEWRMPDSGHLELVAGMTNPDPRAIVAAWESSGRFTDVSAELGRTPGEIRVKAAIIRPKEGTR